MLLVKTGSIIGLFSVCVCSHVFPTQATVDIPYTNLRICLHSNFNYPTSLCNCLHQPSSALLLIIIYAAACAFSQRLYYARHTRLLVSIQI